MFKPLALYIGLRYTRAKRRNHFVSFISLTSMLGIALGVAVLITVLSVMNGFDDQIQNRLFSMTPHMSVTAFQGTLPDWKTLRDKVREFPGVEGASPFILGQSLLSHEGYVAHAITLGIEPTLENSVTSLEENMVSGKLMDLASVKFSMVLGRQLAESLDIRVGDKLNIMIPKATVTPVGIFPRMQRFTVVGIFQTKGGGFGFDSKLAFINLSDAQKLFQLGDGVTGLRLKVKELYDAPRMTPELSEKLNGEYLVGDWTRQFGAFFKAIKMEKTMMFLILVLIIAVAAFNLISSLVMVVNDKQADIAILRTLGAMPRTILAIFMVQGAFVGIIGTLLGVIGGIVLAWNATEIVNWIQAVFHVQFLASNIYYIDYVPSKLEWSDVWHISLIALSMSFIATLYPAWNASRTQPAEALRYE